MQRVRPTNAALTSITDIKYLLATIGALCETQQCMHAIVEEEGDQEAVFLHGTAEATPRRSTKHVACSGGHRHIVAERHRIGKHESTKRRP